MLNRRPIFVFGFARGGTNILLNLLLSHPGVCTTQGEIHQVFEGGAREDTPLRARQRRLCYRAPLVRTLRQDVFGSGNYRPRRMIPAWARRFVDGVLWLEKVLATHEGLNRWKREGVRYRRSEIAGSRLLAKGLHATLLATDVLRATYPDATFLGLVRNGLAVCEGQIRRGRTPEWIGHRYRLLGEAMLAYERRLPEFHLVTYEEIVARPRETFERVYLAAGLDPGVVEKVRFQVKATLDAEGRHRPVGGAERQVVWLPPERMSEHLSPEVNENQIRRLSPTARRRFLVYAGDTMRRLGYA